MILYVSTRSSSLAARLAFILARLPGEVREIGLRAGEGRTPEYLAINPKGQVPALVLDNGEALTETAAILLAIGEMAPRSGLLPDGQMARWRVMEWLAWAAWTIPGTFTPAFAPARFGPPPAESGIREVGLRKVAEALDFAAAGLGARDWFVGDGVTLADPQLVMLTVLAGFLGVAPPDALMDHRRRLFALPVLADTLKAEGFAT